MKTLRCARKCTVPKSLGGPPLEEDDFVLDATDPDAAPVDILDDELVAPVGSHPWLVQDAHIPARELGVQQVDAFDILGIEIQVITGAEAQGVRLDFAEARLHDDDLHTVAVEGRKGLTGAVMLDDLEAKNAAVVLRGLRDVG